MTKKHEIWPKCQKNITLQKTSLEALEEKNFFFWIDNIFVDPKTYIKTALLNKKN